MRRATLCAHGGPPHGLAGDGTSGGVVAPIETSTTFARDADYAVPPTGDVYRRDDNATVRAAERAIASLEGAADARLFASGMAALSVLVRATTGPIVFQDGTYYGTRLLMAELQAAGRSVTLVDASDAEALARACARVRPQLVLVETPSNPWLGVVDIARAAEIAHEVDAWLAVDSTAATPILQTPLTLGADVVVHSATKGLNGHSDVLAGVLVPRDADGALWRRIGAARAIEGAVASPFDAYLLTRGLRTLALRTEASCRSALHIAHVLAAHPRIERVRYPGLTHHPGHAVAARQMTGGFGGLLSFDVAGGREAALAVCARLKVITRATSLGGVESLIEHRHSIEPASTGVPAGLLRLSVGIEAVDDLVDDLMEALAATS